VGDFCERSLGRISLSYHSERKNLFLWYNGKGKFLLNNNGLSITVLQEIIYFQNVGKIDLIVIVTLGASSRH